MLNTSRQVEKMIFTLDQNTNFANTTIYAGPTSITRVNNQYLVFSLIDIQNHYAVLPDTQMHNLLKIVCSGMAKGGFLHDDDTPEDLSATANHLKDSTNTKKFIKKNY